jgi:uncharacterized RDD family membrane protein YckC
MRKLFVSYARENKRDVDELVKHLEMMGYQTWVDAALRGGQEWWDEILARIADTDVVIAIYSSAALNSTACAREFEWAVALGKPVVPVAVEPPPAALPNRFARRQIIDYSQPGQRDRAALQLQGALATLPPAPPVPEPPPDPPKAPMSYLNDIIDEITQQARIDQDRQHDILRELEPAVTSLDPLERQSGRDILERFSRRNDIYRDVDQAITRMRILADQSAPADSGQSTAQTIDPGANASPKKVGSYLRKRKAAMPSVKAGDARTAEQPSGDNGPQNRVATTDGAPPPKPSGQVPEQPGGGDASAPQLVDTLPKTAYTSWIRRVAAAIIDVIPIPIIVGIGGAIATASERQVCHYEGEYTYGWTTVSGHCNYVSEYSGGSYAALWVFSLLAFAYFLFNWGYLQGRVGATIGKRLLKFTVVRTKTGQPVGFFRSILRQFAHIADTLPLVIGYLFPLWDAKRQTFADKIIGTVCQPVPATEKPSHTSSYTS